MEDSLKSLLKWSLEQHPEQSLTSSDSSVVDPEVGSNLNNAWQSLVWPDLIQAKIVLQATILIVVLCTRLLV